MLVAIWIKWWKGRSGLNNPTYGGDLNNETIDAGLFLIWMDFKKKYIVKSI